MYQVSVVAAVAKAIESLSAVGAGAFDYSADKSGWSDHTGCDIEAASKLMEAVITLPAEHHLALMWRVTKDNPRLGENVLKDLTCFVAHHIDNGDRFGREGLMYWVRHWARRDGSVREASHLYGRGRDAHHRFYREKVAICLDSWFIAAKGKLEPLVELYYPRYQCAA